MEMNVPSEGGGPIHDRALLLHGSKRNEILTLTEVHQYGVDSFADPDYIRLYGITPAEWYARGIRLLGRTAVECTRDPLGDRIGRDVASVATSLPPQTKFTVIDPFAGSCNTLYWILRHVFRVRPESPSSWIRRSTNSPLATSPDWIGKSHSRTATTSL